MRKLPFLLPSLLALLLSLPLTAAAEEEPNGEEAAPEIPAPVIQPVSEIGRFRLFDGQYAVTSLKGAELPERNLFRIDTVSGIVWVGKQVQYVDRKSGKVIQQRYWEPFEQYLEGQAHTVAER
ncbi:hypothetical protein OR1_01904 [Geobacter sp. OR-1]|uniref:hypothetical protein n=1 Tax=Geobacter sp. OR-1 TaxID=1266765 RepID=UPI000543EB21|nr:hypothetical protein [Geobacter sp. OR-1]GAM09624.1 hypothetical protein OR1_01904 [Geobacter sp. OR-1]